MHHHLSALNATYVAAALLLAACSSSPRNAEDVETRQLWLDLAAMVASPTEFGPRIGSVVGNALDAAQSASSVRSTHPSPLSSKTTKRRRRTRLRPSR